MKKIRNLITVALLLITLASCDTNKPNQFHFQATCMECDTFYAGLLLVQGC